MSVPKQRQTSGRSRRRRSQHGLDKKITQECPQCKKPVMMHRACEFCGFYKGKQVLNVKTKLDTKKENK